MGHVLDIVNRHWAALEARDWDAQRALYHLDAELILPNATARGVDAIMPVLQAYTDAFEDLSHEIRRAIECDDAVAVELTIRGTHSGPLRGPAGELAPTGRTLELESCDIVVVRDGVIVSWRAYFDMMAFLGQLGQLPA